MLDGFTVGITADRRWEEQAALFERRGATVRHGPAIRTLALGDDARLRRATEEVLARRPAVVIVNTGVGVRSWFSAAETWGVGDALAAALRGARIIARGPKASAAVHAHGLDVDARARTERLHEAVDLACETLRPGDVVAVQLDGSGAGGDTRRLAEAGAHVIEVPVYEWQLPEVDGPAVRLAEAVVAGKVHAVTFTAGPSVRNLMAIAGRHGLDGALRERLTDGSVVVGCVGPVCTDAARDAGLESPSLVTPATARLGPLVRSVTDALARRAIHLDLAGTPVRIAGNTVTIAGVSTSLTDTESHLLRVLASKPDVVVPKPDLLRLVWRDQHADPHVVEAVVARLRRRLGPVAGQLTAVYRRGYVLRT